MDSHSELINRARRILPPRIPAPRNTRIVQLARKDAIKLYMAALPQELLMNIFECFPDDHIESQGRPLRGHALAHCSLVCRNWSSMAQVRLFRKVHLTSRSHLYFFHRTITEHNDLGVCVQRFALYDDEGPGLGVMPVAQMLADCLARTPEVEELVLSQEHTAHLTNAVIDCVRLLPRLNSFELNQRNYLNRAITTSAFDPRLLRSLAPVERLALVNPFMDVIRFLPEVLQRLYPSAARSNRGLKHLEISSSLRITDPINLPSVISSTSIPATLSSLALHFYSELGATRDLERWNTFLSACTNLEHLDIGEVLWRSTLLERLPALKQLLSLGIFAVNPQHEDDIDLDAWQTFSDKLIAYLAKTPRLEHFKLTTFLYGYPHDVFDRFVHRLLTQCSDGDQCRLRSLLISLSNLDLVRIGSTTLLRISQDFDIPQLSLATFELLCTNAKLLERLWLPIPLDSPTQVINAVQTLPNLREAKLHNYSLLIDPEVSLKKHKHYKDFLKCCKILNRALHQIEQIIAIQEMMHPAQQGAQQGGPDEEEEIADEADLIQQIDMAQQAELALQGELPDPQNQDQ